MATLESQLTKDFTPKYREEDPVAYGGYFDVRHISPTRPVFYNRYIPLMMRDPRCKFGIELIRGPILQKVSFEILCTSEEVKQTIQTNLDRFWNRSAPSLLKCMLIYGYCGAEIFYRRNEDTNEWEYDKHKYIDPYDCYPVEKSGHIIGMNVYRSSQEKARMYVPKPKCTWLVNEPEENYYFGRTKLYGAFEPWWEKWSYRGYRDSRCVWFYRNAFMGPIVKYPTGSTPVGIGETGNENNRKANQTIANTILDNLQSGAGATIPSYPEGSSQWEIEPAQSVNVPETLLMYGDSLDNEIWEGMGIPPEVIASDGTGAYAGRLIPDQAFHSVLQDPAACIVNPVVETIIEAILWLKYRRTFSYDVNILGLAKELPPETDGVFPSDMEDDGQLPEQGNPPNGTSQLRGSGGPQANPQTRNQSKIPSKKPQGRR